MTAMPMTATAELDQPIVRAVGYSLLAHCFAHPGDSGDESLLHEAANAARVLVADTPLSILPALVESTSVDDLRSAHIALFSLTSSSDCPTYETAYIDADLVGQTHRMASIAGLYRMFGVEVPPGCARPDDISAELEFMSFLNCKEVYAAKHLGAARVAQARKAQKLFLAEHLGCWAGTFARLVAASPRCTPFYREASEALCAWLAADADRSGVQPVVTASAAVLPAPTQFSHGPEMAPGTRLIPIDDIQ